MSLVFSKVNLKAESGATTEFLCGGTPRKERDLFGWTAYEEFVRENRDAITATVETYTYGDGEEFDANIYEVASYTQRGERFFRNPNVKLKETLEFRF